MYNYLSTVYIQLVEFYTFKLSLRECLCITTDLCDATGSFEPFSTFISGLVIMNQHACVCFSSIALLQLELTRISHLLLIAGLCWLIWLHWVIFNKKNTVWQYIQIHYYWCLNGRFQIRSHALCCYCVISK